MANTHRGEVELGAHTIRLSINAIAEIENVLDMGINEIAAALGDPASIRIGHLRAILWGGLREHHPEMTLFDAGELIAEAGATVAMEKVQEAFVLAFPPAEGGESPPPKRGQGGTGKAS